jgi:hypothetical protein
MGLDINIEFDAAALAAPASFRAGIEKAASILDAAFSNPVTINIQVRYGGNGVPPTGADGGPSNGTPAPYSTIRADLIAAAPGDGNLASLPVGATVQGQSSILVWSAQEKLFGMLPPDGTEIDGSADFGTGIPGSELVGVALHELTHALGRVFYGPTPDIFDLFRFTSPGVRLFDQSIPAVAASYFSVNGGLTKLADYGVNSDPSDFLNPPQSTLSQFDTFNETYSSSTLQTLTALDLTQMDVLGFIPVRPPDLAVRQFHLTFNGGVSANYVVHNVGAGQAAASTTGVFLSTDAHITRTDILLATTTTPTLIPGASDSESTSIAFPSKLVPGTYYLGALADYNNRLAESNGHNNASSLVRVILGNLGNNLLIGTSGNDVMIGGAGNDTFVGGPGKDTLDGGPGADHFVFNAALNPQKNLDTVVDFTPGVDKILLSHTHFAGIGHVGHLLSASHFTVGAAASTPAERIIYDPGNGHLYYDRDGSGSHAHIHFATIATGLALQSSDFLVAA